MSEVNEARKLGKLGIWATILYLGTLGFGIPLLSFLGALSIDEISLNELGDFLAGAFGPLAIFWLVLGFFQQGHELRNSVATLELQAKELANSVEQQRELVQVTREQLEHERDMISRERASRKERIQPRIFLDFAMWIGNGNSKGKYGLNITNAGGSASNVSVSIRDEDNSILEYTSKYLARGSKSERIDAFSGYEAAIISRDLLATVKYMDDDGDFWHLTYELKNPSSSTGFGVFESRVVRRELA